jgi:hypothetical protein
MVHGVEKQNKNFVCIMWVGSIYGIKVITGNKTGTISSSASILGQA